MTFKEKCSDCWKSFISALEDNRIPKSDEEDVTLDDKYKNYTFYQNPVSRRNSTIESKTVENKNGDSYKLTELDTEDLDFNQPSYYTRMAMEERLAAETKDGSLHDPMLRVRMAKIKRHRPYFLMVMSFVQFVLLWVSLGLNQKYTGQFIETKPVFNSMIGASPGVLIRMGARWVPCMMNTTFFYEYSGICCPSGSVGSGLTNSDCAVSDTPGYVCTLGEICAIKPLGNPPNQWYRVIIPIGLHGGFIHYLMNMLIQMRTGFQMERDFNWWRIFIIYFASGIGGFAFGAAFNTTTPSVGCSGSLFGLIACLLIDLVQNWKLIHKPWWELFKMVLQIVISFVLGFLPYVDNFAHIGGFVIGLLVGIIILPSVHIGKKQVLIRRICAIVAIPLFVLTYYGFFKLMYDDSTTCSWCKYLNCIPGMPWCNQKWNAIDS